MAERPAEPVGTQPERTPDEIDAFLAERTLIVASNRGPVTFSAEDDGTFSARKGSGGVVTAVSAIAREREPIWIAAAMTEGDRARAEMAQRRGEGLIEFGDPSEFRLRFVVPSAESYHQYYNVISNPLLWFLQHYLWDTPRTPDITAETWEAWHDGYVAVNRLFADEVLAACDQCTDQPIVMLQDYQLYLCGGFIRERDPDAILQHFVHIPWPDPDYWRLLPLAMRRAICEGMLGNDVVGFQTPEHARSFMYTCEAYVPGASIDYVNQAISWNGRVTEVRSYPISIDTEAVRAPPTARRRGRTIATSPTTGTSSPSSASTGRSRARTSSAASSPSIGSWRRTRSFRAGSTSWRLRCRRGWTSTSTRTTSTTSAPPSAASTRATPTSRPAGSRSTSSWGRTTPAPWRR